LHEDKFACLLACMLEAILVRQLLLDLLSLLAV